VVKSREQQVLVLSMHIPGILMIPLKCGKENVLMIKILFQTGNDRAALILRIILGVVFFPHGVQKLLGWYGGLGFSGTMHMFTTNMGIPTLFAFLAIMAEGLGSLGY